MPVCACGCGQGFKRRAGKGVPHRFIPGHQLNTVTARSRQCIARPPLKPPADYPTHGLCLCGCGQKTTISTTNIPSANRYVGFPRLFVHGHNVKAAAAARRIRPILVKRIVTQRGYVRVYCPTHPHAVRGFVAEHRLVMERELGRLLTTNEHVHHKNGDRQDNRRENLERMDASEHLRLHHEAGEHPSHSAAANAKRRATWAAKRRAIVT